MQREWWRKVSWRAVLLCTGMVSLIWFLIRVLPKPSRAAYPCQRAAAPLASAFVLWLLVAVGSAKAWARARVWCRGGHPLRAALALALAVVGGFVVCVTAPRESAQADPPASHGPLGVGQGVHPGRVVWVHAPDATDWSGPQSTEPWWQTNHTDLAVVEEMVSEAVRRLAGEPTEAAAWAALFRHCNARQGRGAQGYQAGEVVTLKINLTTCNPRSDGVDPATYEKRPQYMNRVDNSPQVLLALLRQLVYRAGVAPQDIQVGDPTGLFPKFMFDFLHAEFPEVAFFDNRGGQGRARTEFSDRPFRWSTAAADGKEPDYLPVPFAEASYLLNVAVLKGHGCGVTLCAKNHYGSLLRCPDGYLRDHAEWPDYLDLHAGLAGMGGPLGYGHYRPLVDLMGHRELGARTLLYVIDGLFAGYYWEGIPRPWLQPPFGDGVRGDWPSSLFVSQDPVAIDSVAYDFLRQEWPRVVTGGTGPTGALGGGEQDYLHEAAQADSPPSGTVYDPERDGTRLASLGVHEHWNDATLRQYSRNLGSEEGIELVRARVDSTPPRLLLERSPQGVDLSWPAAHAGYALQSCTVLGGGWTNIDTWPRFVAGRNVVTSPLDRPAGFYRLSR